MAAAVSAWGKPGAWALDSEEHEDELLKKEEQPISGNLKSPAPASAPATAAPLSDFPSLTVAATTKTKKKKGQTLSLAEFTSIGVAKPAPTTYQPKGLTQEDLIVLPTGPRERTAEELERSRTGGFRSYSSNDRTSRYSNDEQPRRQGGFGKDSAGEFASSRADEVDDWGAKKKSSIGGGGFERRERGVGFFDSQSRADESDSWVSKKSFVPSEGRRFNGGFERRGGFESNGGGGGADSDNWGKKKEFGSFDNIRERRGGYEPASNGGADSDNWGKKREEGNGASGRPRLNLQPRKLPVGEVQQSETLTVKPRVGSNPFGDAKPREEVLREKGQDWKELDEKLDSMKKIKEAADGKRSFDSGNGRARLPEDRFQKSWRKPDSLDVRPQSAEKSENGAAEEEEAESLSTTTQV